MKLKAPPLEIPIHEPFRNDLLGRKDSADGLSELLKSCEDSLVLCINGRWGDGKTTFLKMWRQHLINFSFRTLYFNAWENDFSDDALVSLIGEFDVMIETSGKRDATTAKAKSYLRKAKRFGAVLIKKGIPIGIRLATSGLINIDANVAEKIPDDIEKSLSEAAERLANEQIENYQASKKTVAGFKEQLKEFAEHVTAPKQGQERLPLVIFVDELDRCRPSYAVQVLEKIKHLFNVPNIVFVLAMDKEQLGYSVRAMYGQGMDSDGYLRRFIDLDYNLPIPQGVRFFRAQFDRFGLREFFAKRTGSNASDYKDISELLTQLFGGFRFTLREQEHSFALLSLAIRTTPVDHFLYPLLLGTLIVIKIRDPQLYQDFVTGKRSYRDVVAYLSSTVEGKKLMDASVGCRLEAYLAVCRSGWEELEQALQYYGDTTRSNPSQDPLQIERSNKIVNALRYLQDSVRTGPLDYLVRKIDMVSRFER